MNKAPVLVTIVTITYNSEKTIEDTLVSILEQSYNHLEYIVIDGKSSDSTLNVVEGYRDQFVAKGIELKVISENDEGIADAWNKGLKRAKGEIIGILNSDDWYDSKSVAIAVKALNPSKNQISYGICKRVNEDKRVVHTMQTNFSAKRVYLNFGFSHTTCFVTKNTYKALGFFDDQFKIAMDIDFLLRSVIKNVKFIKANNITYMRLGGISTKFRKEALLEQEKALKKNNYNGLLIFIFGVLKRVKLLLD